MRASFETYRKVAKVCSAYEPMSDTKISNSCCDTSDISCTNCKHFDKDKYCVLDLYDEIVESHHLQ